jgi:hypothetical protein
VKSLIAGAVFRNTSFVAATLICLILLFGSEAAAERDGQPGGVKVVVYVIEASDGVPGVDPEIRHIVKQFHETFRYSTYQIVSKVPRNVPMGGEAKIALPGLRELRLYPRGYEEGRIRMKVRIVEKSTRGRSRDVLNTEFRLIKGGTIVMGDYNYHKGKLILAISTDM